MRPWLASQAKKALSGMMPLGLGPKRQRGAVGLPLVEEVTLVGLEGGEADRGRVGDVEGAQVLDQVSEVVNAAGDGGLGVTVAGQPPQVLLGRQRERRHCAPPKVPSCPPFVPRPTPTATTI